MSDRMPYKMSESERTEYIYIHYSIRMSNRMLNKLWERVSEYVSVGGGNILYVLVYVCICMYMYVYMYIYICFEPHLQGLVPLYFKDWLQRC